MLELNKMVTIEAKLDAIVNRLNNQQRRSHNVNKVGLMQGEETDQEVAQEGAYHLEECNYLNKGRSYHFKPNPNLLTHYTPALRNHENLSYGRGAHQGQGSRPTQQYNKYHHQSLALAGYQRENQGNLRPDHQEQKGT